ncbi:sugar ABC transporter substrate-binding protein [Sphingomonas spermidinifaciens]|uniref:Sugar ABC transporter substrate-binding protein n=1 Tax=Sphingomonas spermidinifaciens TaxID=1141889 RepID=A0A2A4B1J8_9SPHN|nr:polysaccharide biosynthesis/export family protein [Sphingomonas spermidinifaciens]PCD01835.1 sugar ABC transporter substrate-binding protein [Sphingomonas spermidinifaciens]
MPIKNTILHGALAASLGLVPGAVLAQTAPGPAGNPARATANRPATAPAGYVLGSNDEIQITVFGQEGLSVKTRIKDDGTVNLAFVGPIQAAGKTTLQLGQDIARAYASGGYLASPSVNVDVTDFISSRVTVLGFVPNPGNYALNRDYTIASLVAEAGGVKENGANFVILTPGDKSPPVRISLADLQGDASRRVNPGDQIFVPQVETVYVYGQVNKPGSFPLRPDMTYRQAMAEAGGPTLAASKKIEVRRKGQKVDNVSLDDLVQPDDVLVVKERIF